MSTVLITGCSSGFGLRSAVAVAEAGHLVVATMRDLGRADGLRTAARAAGVDVEVLELDVTADDSVRRAVDSVVDRHGGLDAVVNNAGLEVRGPVEAVSDADVRTQFETNVFGLLRVVWATAPLLKASDDGVLVNVSSIGGIIARPFAGIYAASKHAVEAISEALHFELGLFGVRVHVIEPGQFPTSLAANTVSAAELGDPSDDVYRAVGQVVEEKIKGLVPGGGGADPNDVADAIITAIGSPDTPLRTVVGGDAQLIMAARHGNSFEDYELTMRSALDYWEGFRGNRP